MDWPQVGADGPPISGHLRRGSNADQCAHRGGVPPGARRGVPHDLLRARLEAKAKAELTEASATVRVGQPVTGLGDTTVKLPGTSAISMGYRGRGGFPRQALPAAPALPGSRCLLRACRAARRP